MNTFRGTIQRQNFFFFNNLHCMLDSGINQIRIVFWITNPKAVKLSFPMSSALRPQMIRLSSIICAEVRCSTTSSLCLATAVHTDDNYSKRIIISLIVIVSVIVACMEALFFITSPVTRSNHICQFPPERPVRRGAAPVLHW